MKSNNKYLFEQKQNRLITFSDNGIGFDDRYKDRIFEVFQRLHSTEEYTGAGMLIATDRLGKGAQFDIIFVQNKIILT